MIKNSVRTSVDDGAAVVEDDPALVQSRDCVQQVEGPQIPLRPGLRTIKLLQSHQLKICCELHWEIKTQKSIFSTINI